ncbi:MAG: T9SS type A sorting domain-containing protein [Bacteroidota bacterium]
MKYFLLLLTFLLLNLSNTKSQCLNDLYLGFGGAGIDEGKAIITDEAGNSYIAGTFVDAIQLGSFSLTTTDSIALFLAKLTPAGNVLWAKKIITNFSNYYNTILKINDAGQLVMAGTCDNHFSDFDTLMQPFVDGDIYVSKFNPADGTLQGFLSMGNHGYSWVNDFSTDPGNNIYVTGGFVGPVSFGPYNLQCTGTTNTFIARFNTNDQADWAMRVTNNLTSGNFSSKINFDGAQHIYVCGWYGISCDFGNGNVLTSADYSNGYLTKLDTAGNIEWARTSIPGKTYFHQVIIDTTSILVISESPATLVNYNQNGDTIWTKALSHNSYNLFRQLILFKESLFAIGTFSNSILFGDSTCTVDGTNIFIARFQLDGSFDWMRTVHTTYNAYPESIDIDTSGNFHIAGSYQGQDTLDYVHAMPVFGTREVLYLELCNGAVSVSDLKNGPELTLFPIPFSENLIISGTKENGVMSIYDMTGREILKCKSADIRTEIFTGDFHSGIYLVRYSSADQSFSWKVIKN